jgi:hypothetical protein
MTTQYLTRDDEAAWGTDLISLSQRAAMQAVQPHLQYLQGENDHLQQQLAREQRHRLDQQVEAAVPNYREIDNQPEFHRWLLGVDQLNGRIRQELLNEAISRGDASSCVAFFRGFEREHGASHGDHHESGQARQSRAPGTRTWTPSQIKDLYARHRRGQIGDESFRKAEQDLFAAQREGRVLAPVFLTK